MCRRAGQVRSRVYSKFVLFSYRKTDFTCFKQLTMNKTKAIIIQNICLIKYAWYLRLCQTCPMDLIRIIKPDPGQNSRLSLENLTWCLLTIACDTFTLRPRGFGPGLYKVWRPNTWLTPHTALAHRAGKIIVIQIFLGKMDEISWK